MKPGHHRASLKIQQYDDNPTNDVLELGYLISTRDTTLVLYRYKSKSFDLIDSTIYKRVAQKSLDNDAAYGIDLFVKQKLIIGNYSSTDSINNTSLVKFNLDGTVSGLADFKTYAVGTDFMAGPENNLDVVYFDNVQQNTLAYRVVKDTLKFYSTKENYDHSLLTLGKIRYKLVRQK